MGLNQESFLSVQSLIKQAGICEEIRTILPSSRGGNNRIYAVETSNRKYAAKQYFRHDGDTRDRLTSEYTFLEYATKVAGQFVPVPYWCDRESGWALYEYLEGVHIDANSLTGQHVRQAAQFFVELNKPDARGLRKSFNLPRASEACFTISDHLKLVHGRILMLLDSISKESEKKAAAQAFVNNLHDTWVSLSEKISHLASKQKTLIEPLTQEQMCISPSDFGFHNALLQADGKIKFIDFEYAGLDDPAKMVGDFFAQLAVPVPPEFFNKFTQETMQIFTDAERLISRAKLLRLVYQVKWCCIAMNVFLPVHLARRKFANPELDESRIQELQLHKAVQLFQTIKQEMTNGIY